MMVQDLDPSPLALVTDEKDGVRDRSNKFTIKKLWFGVLLALIALMCKATVSHSDISGLDQVHQKILPFSYLNKDSHLIGQYSIDNEYRYWPMQDSNPTVKDSSSSGMIYFPSVDLTTRLVEDATNVQLRSRLLGNATELFSDIVPILDDTEHRSAILTLKGYKGATPNQDRSLIAKFFIENTTTLESNVKNHNMQEAVLMGIFDGHGERGHEVSQHVALELPKVFSRRMKEQLNKSYTSPMDPKYDDMIREVLISTFLAVDSTEPVKGSGASGGSTSSTIFYPGVGSKLVMANAGDSTTIIAHFSRSSQVATITKQNRKDKPHLEEERKRIEDAGGQVYIPFQLPSSNYGPKESSRLLITLPGGFQLGLAMSRSIGDAEGKAFGLTAEPTVEIFDVQQYYSDHQFSEEQIEDSEWFVVIASDGVYDVLPPEKVVQRLGKALYNGEKLDALRTCEQLIREASRLWIKASIGQAYRDDITLGVSNIQLQF